MAGGKDWGRRQAPDLADFEELAAQAWAAAAARRSATLPATW